MLDKAKEWEMKALTFFVRVDGANVPLEMLSSMEALAAALNLADVVAFVRLGNGIDSLGRRNTATATLFGEIGHRRREECTSPGHPTLP